MSRSVEHELLLHTAALRRLARQLVGAQHADDLVQDTALLALQTTPRRPGPLGGWLRGIVRHLAMHHRRGELRRRARELAQARPEEVPPDRSVAERDTLRRLSEAVLSLPEPYGQVLLQRYLRERSPQQIARASGVPLATVKSQLQRGLQLLRERLQRDGGDWRAALVAGFGIEHALPIAAATTSGVLLMSTMAKWAAAAAVLLAASGGLWWALRPPMPAVREPVDAMSVAAAGTEAGAARPTAGTIGPVPAALQRVAAPPAPARGNGAVLRGRCVDDHGPLAGVAVELHGARAEGTADESIDLHAATGADGSFAFTFAPVTGQSFRLQLQAEEMADSEATWNHIAADATIDLGDVLLLRAVAVRGRVFDEQGAPVPGTSVHLRRGDRDDGPARPRPYQSATTRDDGTFACGFGLASGSWQADVQARELVADGTVLLQAPAADLRLVVRTVSASHTIAGVATDETGAPLARVAIRTVPTRDGALHRTRRDGSFELIRGRDAGDEPVRLAFEKPGYETEETEAVAWGSRDLRVVLHANGGQIVHVVRLDDGAPVEHCTLHALWLAQPGAAHSNENHATVRGPFARGRAVLHLRSGEYRLLVEPDDAQLDCSELLPFTVAGADASTVVRLPPRLERRVRVQYRDGSPVAGALVQRCLPPLRPERFLDVCMPLDPWLLQANWDNVSLRLEAGITDDRGELLLHGSCGRSDTLVLPGPGHAPCGVPFGVEGDGPQVITVAAGAHLRGRCTPPASVAALRAPALRLRGDGAARFPDLDRPPIAIDAEGRFDVEGAPPGAWRIELRLTTVNDGGGTFTSGVPVGRVDLREGETAFATVDLAPLQCEEGTLDVMVLHNGEPLRNAFVMPMAVAAPDSVSLAGRASWTSRIDAEGHMHSERWQGRYRLLWSPKGVQGPDARSLRADEILEVVPGQTTKGTVHFRSGTLRVHVRDAAQRPLPGIAVELVDATGEWCATLPPTDRDGAAEQLVEAGTFTCRALPAELLAQNPQRASQRPRQHGEDPLAPSLLPLGEVLVQQGATTQVVLQLPPAKPH
ncbi:MAG TPA: sigma-70 family RNA polymerase sigma factor [Planctomycetota bacterium]|nr:sigma-70 family RNA polymerase sigma factor [Planctomycetota bacterium]